METSVVTVVDLDMKVGASKKGPWTLCTLTGSDREKYKTFDENLIAKLRQAQAKGGPIVVNYQPEPRHYIDRNGEKQETIERTIKSIDAAPSASQPAAAPSAAKPSTAPKIDKMPPEYWEKKDRLEYQRMAHMSALKACADIMAACIGAKIESYKFHDALQIVKVEADKLYAGFYKSYEGGTDHGADEISDGEQFDYPDTVNQ
jgi:hypothetical protein